MLLKIDIVGRAGAAAAAGRVTGAVELLIHEHNITYAIAHAASIASVVLEAH